MDRKTAEKIKAEVINEWFDEVKAATDHIGHDNAVKIGDKIMPLHMSVSGEVPQWNAPCTTATTSAASLTANFP